MERSFDEPGSELLQDAALAEEILRGLVIGQKLVDELVEERRLALRQVAVGTILRPFGLGPPPAQIPASGTTALGSCLGL